jgi:hypothetical protein
MIPITTNELHGWLGGNDASAANETRVTTLTGRLAAQAPVTALTVRHALSVQVDARI